MFSNCVSRIQCYQWKKQTWFMTTAGILWWVLWTLLHAGMFRVCSIFRNLNSRRLHVLEYHNKKKLQFRYDEISYNAIRGVPQIGTKNHIILRWTQNTWRVYCCHTTTGRQCYHKFTILWKLIILSKTSQPVKLLCTPTI